MEKEMSEVIDKKLALTVNKISERIKRIRLVTCLSPISLNQVDVELNGILLDLRKLLEK